jgi:ribonuclease HII
MAKVLRDRLMARLAGRHIHYRWEQNAGYGTKAHRDAILEFGHTRHHRQSFGDLFSNPMLEGANALDDAFTGIRSPTQ